MVAPATIPGIHQAGTHAARPAANTVAAGALYACSTHSKVYQSDGTSWSDWLSPGGIGSGQTFVMSCILGDGVNVISTSMFADMYFPFAATITGVVGLADASGSVTVEPRASTYAAYDPPTHPVTGDKICASAPLTISAAKKAKDTTLTGWTTAIAADTVIRWIPTGSPATIKQLTVSLIYTR
jgi:hypothetical protein